MKRLCYWKRKAWYRLLSGSGLKKNCVRFHHQASFWRGWNISYENNCAPLKMKGQFHFSYAVSQGACFSPCWMLVLKVSRRNTNFFWSFKLPLCGLVRNVRFLRNICGVFKKYIYFLINTHVFTYRRRQEFQNILERKLCSCFGQLLLIY